MRLIDADAVYKILESCEIKKATIGNPLTDWEDGYTCGIERGESEIDCALTVEAVPVRHGKWDKGTDSYWHICEECGAEVDISMGTGVWVEGVELYELNYCPNCGAKMDAEREE